jgi:diguanylate cyclase (GGDEF)-like protein
VAVDAKTPNDLGWRIVVRQPLDEALAPARALRDRLIVLGFIAALGFGLLALPLAHTVSRPIEQLAATAQQIEQRSGQPTAPVRTRLREVQQLDQSIQSMTRSLLAREQELETLNQTLEQQVTQRTQALETANQELERLATHDALTGLYNRRHCDDGLAECIAAGLRTGRPFGMFILDADHFKQINDRFGHATGDLVLQQVAEVLRSQVRQTDLAARYGGEEFVVVLPLNDDAEGVAQVAEKVRAAIEAAEFSDVGKVTVSIGTCIWEPPNNSVAGLVHQADLALYRAKALGRNRVEAAAPTA